MVLFFPLLAGSSSSPASAFRPSSTTPMQGAKRRRSSVISISLQSLPLRPSTLTALLRSGICTTGDIGSIGSIATLAEDLGCSTAQAVEYMGEINEILESSGMPQVLGNDTRCAGPAPATAASLLRSKLTNQSGTAKQNRQIVSFSQSLDVLLGGGVALAELTEICGRPGSGKTQLAMQLCVDARLPSKYGGVEGSVVVIDAEGSWSCSGMDRLWDMSVALVDHLRGSAARRVAARNAIEGRADVPEINSLVSLTPESLLEGIHIFRVHDEPSQTCTLYSLPKFLQQQEERGIPVKLVVIDSLAFHYRVASSAAAGSGQSNSLSTTHNLTRMAAFLTDMANEFDLAVVAINHLTTRIDKDSTSKGGSNSKLVPALGESWAHSVTSRLMIDHYRHPKFDMNEVRSVSLLKSPHKPPGTALLMITEKGIRGVPQERGASHS